MRYQINSFDYLKTSIANLADDPNQWADYPCIIWERGKSMGYGSLGTNQGGSTFSHWLAYELTYGTIPEGQRVRHKCGVHACFRPSHLYAHSNIVFLTQNLDAISLPSEYKWSDYKCLLWKYGRGSHGYGDVTCETGKDMAHRLSYKRFHGEIPIGMDICHRCDVRLCYHPAHLFLGTRMDNVQDMISKGRKVIIRGESAAKAKLTDSQVIEIRALHSGGMNHCEIAKMFPVDRRTVGNIVRRKIWTHI